MSLVLHFNDRVHGAAERLRATGGGVQGDVCEDAVCLFSKKRGGDIRLGKQIICAYGPHGCFPTLCPNSKNAIPDSRTQPSSPSEVLTMERLAEECLRRLGVRPGTGVCHTPATTPPPSTAPPPAPARLPPVERRLMELLPLPRLLRPPPMPLPLPRPPPPSLPRSLPPLPTLNRETFSLSIRDESRTDSKGYHIGTKASSGPFSEYLYAPQNAELDTPSKHSIRTFHLRMKDPSGTRREAHSSYPPTPAHIPACIDKQPLCQYEQA